MTKAEFAAICAAIRNIARRVLRFSESLKSVFIREKNLNEELDEWK